MIYMKCKWSSKPSKYNKWKYTLITSLLLILLTNTLTLQILNMGFKNAINTSIIESTCAIPYPNTMGYVAIILLFTLALRYTMDLKI